MLKGIPGSRVNMRIMDSKRFILAFIQVSSIGAAFIIADSRGYFHTFSDFS